MLNGRQNMKQIAKGKITDNPQRENKKLKTNEKVEDDFKINWLNFGLKYASKY